MTGNPVSAQRAKRAQLPRSAIRAAMRARRRRASMPAAADMALPDPRVGDPRAAASWRPPSVEDPPLRADLRSLAVALVALAAAAIGCGGGDTPPPAPSPTPAGSEGRPIEGAPGARAEVTTTAVRFVRGYLAFQAGRIEPDQVPAATEELRTALRRQRVPPAQRARRAEIVRAGVDRLDAASARVTVQVRNVDEQLVYPLPIDLLRRGGRWLVLSAGDDA
jgi:hypothetical protein